MNKKLVTSETMPTDGKFIAIRYLSKQPDEVVSCEWRHGGLFAWHVGEICNVDGWMDFISGCDTFITSIEGD